jgi:hypothetical protein
MSDKREVSMLPMDLPGFTALNAIQRVMAANQKEKGNGWMDITIKEHLYHAAIHINKEGFSEGEDHLSHALTRIAMAITLRDGGLK